MNFAWELDIKKTTINSEYDPYIEQQRKDGIPVIIAAAGSSSRMLGINKQFASLCGIPVLARTLLSFQRAGAISKIIVVTSADSVKDVELLAEKYMIDKLSDIVVGASSRAESVKNGLDRLDKNESRVLIHDGARPLVDEQTINRVIDALKEHKAVTCAVPVKDTVKLADKDGFITETLPREQLISVQTPQGVDVTLYREAIDKAQDISVFTDDMSVMEAAGITAVSVMGSYKNIKITTPEDLIVAQAYIESEEEE